MRSIANRLWGFHNLPAAIANKTYDTPEEFMLDIVKNYSKTSSACNAKDFQNPIDYPLVSFKSHTLREHDQRNIRVELNNLFKGIGYVPQDVTYFSYNCGELKWLTKKEYKRCKLQEWDNDEVLDWFKKY